jgi:hypothetical protein
MNSCLSSCVVVCALTSTQAASISFDAPPYTPDPLVSHDPGYTEGAELKTNKVIGQTFLVNPNEGAPAFNIDGVSFKIAATENFATVTSVEFTYSFYSNITVDNNGKNWEGTLLAPSVNVSLSGVALENLVAGSYMNLGLSAIETAAIGNLLPDTKYAVILGVTYTYSDEDENAEILLSWEDGKQGAGSYADGYAVKTQEGNGTDIEDPTNGSFSADTTFYIHGVAVPEPSTFALLGLGAGLLMYRRR